MPTIKRLQFANGTDVLPATDLSLESATDKLKTYVDDAAYVADNGAANPGDIYINTTLNAVRLYSGAQWWTVVIKENAIIVDDNFSLVDNGDNTKVGKFDVSNVTPGTTKTYAVPAITTSSDVLVTKDATQELKNKTIDGNFNTLTNLDFGTLSGEVNPQNGGTGISNPAGATLTRTGAFDLNITTTAASAVTMPTSGTLATLTDISATQLTGTLAPSKGGTGVSNNDAATLTRSGNHAVTLTTTATTSVTLPTTGTLATLTDISATNLSGIVPTSKGGTGQNSTATFPTTGTVAVLGDISASNLSGIVPGSKGGTGVNNAGTLTYGANNITITTTGATGITLPTAGTLATLAGSESLSAKTLVEPVVDNFAAFNVETTPGTAAANTVRVYAKSDNKLYKMDSTGTEAAIGSGSGSGGINYLADWNDATKPIGTVSTVAANGNITVSGAGTPTLTSAWYADATSGAAAIAASATTALRGSSNYLTALSGASTSGATFVQSAAFQVDASDLGKPVTISFDLTGVTTDDDWDVVVARYSTTGSAGTGTFVELISVAGNVSSTTGTPGAKLPTSTTQFKGFFIASATANDVYSLRLRRRAGSTQIRIDSLAVGPQSLAQGAVVTAWQSFTPVWTNLSTSANVGSYRRVGDSMEIQVVATSSGASGGTINFAIPNGLTMDSAKISSSTSGGIIGSAMAYDGTTNYYAGNPIYQTSTTIAVRPTGTTGAWGSSTPFSWANNSVIGIKIMVPISQWSSGTTTLADRAVEEYASYNGTTTVYGPGGSALPNITASAVNTRTSYIVTWQTSVLPTDKIVLEGSVDQINWVDIGSGATEGNWTWGKFTLQSTGSDSRYYGVGFRNGSGNTSVVEFGNAGGRVSPAGAYGAVGTSWASGNGYWRLRKIAGGAAIGFPVSARNIVGDTSGTSVPTGMVGEIKETTISTSAFTTEAEVGSITLTEGVWLVNGTLNGNSGSGAVVVTAKWRIKGQDGGVQGKDYLLNTQVSTERGLTTMPARVIYVASSDSDKTIKIRASNSLSQAFAGYMSAIRIA